MITSTFVRKFGRTLLLILFFFAVIGAVLFVSNSVFRLKKIEINGEGLSISVNQEKLQGNLLFIKTEPLERQTLADNPLIEKIVITKKFPQTLVISATERKPIARLPTVGGPVSIDKDGVILGNVGDMQALPAIQREPLETIQAGTKSQDPMILSQVSFLSSVQSLVIIKRIENNDSKSYRAKTDKTDIIVAQNSDILTVTSTLQTLLAGFRIKGTMPTMIDLRYDKPIVRF